MWWIMPRGGVAWSAWSATSGATPLVLITKRLYKTVPHDWVLPSRQELKVRIVSLGGRQTGRCQHLPAVQQLTLGGRQTGRCQHLPAVQQLTSCCNPCILPSAVNLMSIYESWSSQVYKLDVRP